MNTRNSDIMLWPDGVWCFSEELDEMLTYKSDDYRIIEEDTLEWDKLVSE